MNTIRHIKDWWIIRNSWWLIIAIAAFGACMEAGVALAVGAKVSAALFAFWIFLALFWMVIQFLTELRARRAERRIEQLERSPRPAREGRP